MLSKKKKSTLLIICAVLALFLVVAAVSIHLINLNSDSNSASANDENDNLTKSTLPSSTTDIFGEYCLKTETNNENFFDCLVIDGAGISHYKKESQNEEFVNNSVNEISAIWGEENQTAISTSANNNQVSGVSFFQTSYDFFTCDDCKTKSEIEQTCAITLDDWNPVRNSQTIISKYGGIIYSNSEEPSQWEKKILKGKEVKDIDFSKPRIWVADYSSFTEKTQKCGTKDTETVPQTGVEFYNDASIWKVLQEL